MTSINQNNSLNASIPYFALTSSFIETVNQPIYREDGGCDYKALALKVCGIALPLILMINILLLPFIACSTNSPVVPDLNLVEAPLPPQHLTPVELETQKLLSFNLPLNRDQHIALQTALYCDFQGLDFSQLTLQSLRTVNFVGMYRPMANVPNFVVSTTGPQDGYEIQLTSPRGPISYYMHEHDNNIYPPADVSQVVPY